MGSGFSKRKKQMRMMQEQFAKAQEDMAKTVVEGTAGNGLVTVKMNGEYNLIDIKINKECVDPDDVEGLEDLIKVAHKQAMDKLNEQGQGQLPTDAMGLLGGLS